MRYTSTEEQKEPRHEDSPPCSLSGLHSLYTGIDESNDTLVDMETIWGQVDLQNNVLLPLLKKGIRKLAKIPDGEDGIRLLDMGDLSDEETAANSDEESDIDEGSAASMDEGSAASNMREDEESDGEMDEDARRIRERMEKVSLMYWVLSKPSCLQWLQISQTFVHTTTRQWPIWMDATMTLMKMKKKSNSYQSQTNSKQSRPKPKKWRI